MIFPHTVQLHPAVAVVDERGNIVHRPVAEPIESAAFVQPRSSAEDGQAVSDTAIVYLPPATPRLNAASLLRWDGVDYEAVGAAVALHTPIGRHHWRIMLRKVGS